MNPYEDRVTWDELAPSVQELFKTISESFSKIEGIIDALNPILDNLSELGTDPIKSNLLNLGNTNTTNNLLYLDNNKNDIENLLNDQQNFLTKNDLDDINELVEEKQDILTMINIFGGQGQKNINWAGEPNKIVKTDNNGKLILDNFIYFEMAAENADDLNFLSNAITTEGIFNSWDRISSNPVTYTGVNKNVQNLTNSTHNAARAGYFYDSSRDILFNSCNSSAWSGFISNDEYNKNYIIRFALDFTNYPATPPNASSWGLLSDDDTLSYIVGYMVDSDGVFHTLQVLRMGTSSSSTIKFCLAYDHYGNYGSAIDSLPVNILAHATPTSLVSTNWKDKYTLIEVERKGTQIIARTGDPVTAANKANAQLNVEISYTLPATKPANMDQTMYDNIKYMLENKSKIGFATYSNCCGINIIYENTSGLFEAKIFSLYDGKIKEFNGQSSTPVSEVPITDNDIRPNSLLYSAYNKKLFYYIKDTDFVRIEL